MWRIHGLWPAVHWPLLGVYSHLRTGNVIPSVNQKHCLNTSWKFSFLDLGFRQALGSPDDIGLGVAEVDFTSQGPGIHTVVQLIETQS